MIDEHSFTTNENLFVTEDLSHHLHCVMRSIVLQVNPCDETDNCIDHIDRFIQQAADILRIKAATATNLPFPNRSN